MRLIRLAVALAALAVIMAGIGYLSLVAGSQATP